MSKRTNRILLVLLCIVAICSLTVFTACGGGKTNTEDTTPPVITLTGEVPTSGLLGRAVTIPGATATDETDGDLTNSVKVTVAGLKEDGTVGREFIYNKSAKDAQSFTPARYIDYTIEYSVKDAAGNKATLLFEFTGLEDNLKPEITITQSGFDASVGIKGDNLNGFVLPSAKGIDQPGDLDITDRLGFSVKSGDTVVTSGSYSLSKQYLVPGSYTVVYTLSDTAGNTADSVSFPLVVEEADLTGHNLLNPYSVALGYDSYFNEYGELVVGKRADLHGDDNMASATLKGRKINYGEIVGISLNMDAVPTSGGEVFFDICFAFQRSTGVTPSGLECQWPKLFDIRFEATNTVIRGSNSGDGYNANGSASMRSLRDGKDHMIYLQLVKTGENPTDTGAKITLYGWVDEIPYADDVEPTFAAFLTRGQTDAQGGVIAADTFDEIWADTGNWLTFGSYSSGKDATGNWANDVMTIKGIALYGADEKDFATDIQAPVITLDKAVESVYMIGEKANFPGATAVDADSNFDGNVKLVLIGSDGARTEISADYTPTVKGDYTLVYLATDPSGNHAYLYYAVRFAEQDTVPPEITLSSEETINVGINEEFTIPSATAQDDKDGDISSKIVVNMLGPDCEDDIWASEQLTKWSFAAVGTHTIQYVVADEFGNTATKEVTVNVTGGVTGDLVSKMTGYSASTQEVLIASGSSTIYSGQKVFDEKVSLILNVSSNSGLFFLNILGDYANDEWPNGMVMRFTGSTLEVSALGHDKYLFGYFEDPFKNPYNRDWNVLFEYQTTIIEVDGEQYVRVRIWFCGTELVPTRTEHGGVKYSELVPNGEGGGVCLAVSAVQENAPQNLKAGYIHYNSYNGFTVSVKGMRIDGQAFPEGSWSVPDDSRALGMDLPTFATESAKANFTGDTTTVTSGDVTGAQPNSCKTFITAPKVAASSETAVTLETVNFSLQFQANEGGALNFTKRVKLLVLGDKPSSVWSTGMGLEIYDKDGNDKWIAVTAPNGTQVAWIDREGGGEDAAAVHAALFGGEKVYISYTITYNLKNGKVDSLTFKVLFGLEENGSVVWKSAPLYYPEAGATISDDKLSVTIPTSLASGAAGIVPNGTSMSIVGNTDNGNDEAGYCAIIGDVSVGDPTKA